MLAKLSTDIGAKQKEAEEFRNLLMELYQAEAERRADEELARKRALQLQRLEEMKKANVEQLRRRELKRLETERQEQDERLALLEVAQRIQPRAASRMRGDERRERHCQHQPGHQPV